MEDSEQDREEDDTGVKTNETVPAQPGKMHKIIGAPSSEPTG